MTELKQWHDEDGITFHAQTCVYFSQCGRNRVLSLHELLRITSDTAVEEYRRRGLSREFLAEHQLAILVSRVAFRIHRMPVENERVTVTTWEEVPEALQLMRAYEITDTDSSEPLVSGLSSWLVVDLAGRRIIPTKRFDLRTPSTIRKPHDCMRPGKIPVPDGLAPIGDRLIRRSDLDANGHTNNARYGAFILDALPGEYAERPVKDFRLNYSKEAMLGDTLRLLAHFDDAAGTACVVGRTPDGNSFESELYF